MAAQIMLGGEDLNGAFRRQRGADRVGADGRLTPVRALDEAEPVGVAEHLVGPRPPQHATHRVGHDENVLPLCDKRFQAVSDVVEHLDEAGRTAQGLQPGRLDDR